IPISMARADEPPASTVERDLRSKLDPEWVAKATKVTVQRAGNVQTREGYLGKQDTKTTTFFGFDYNVEYEYKDGGKKVCGMSIVYYKKATKWQLESVTEVR